MKQDDITAELDKPISRELLGSGGPPPAPATPPPAADACPGEYPRA